MSALLGLLRFDEADFGGVDLAFLAVGVFEDVETAFVESGFVGGADDIAIAKREGIALCAAAGEQCEEE